LLHIGTRDIKDVPDSKSIYVGSITKQNKTKQKTFAEKRGISPGFPLAARAATQQTAICNSHRRENFKSYVSLRK
jgi:hypothetical protein